jgi:hypothetical protein
VACHVLSHHVSPWHVASHPVASHHATSQPVMSCSVMSHPLKCLPATCLVALRHVRPVISCPEMSNHACHVVSCDATCHVMGRVTLRNVMSHPGMSHQGPFIKYVRTGGLAKAYGTRRGGRGGLAYAHIKPYKLRYQKKRVVPAYLYFDLHVHDL